MAVADGRNSLQNLDEYTLGRDLYYKKIGRASCRERV